MGIRLIAINKELLIAEPPRARSARKRGPPYLKGQCPDYAHARASSVFSSKDNRTVILIRQDFLPDHTADGDFLFTFSSNILDFRRSLSSYLKFGSRHEDYRNFVTSRTASRPEKLLLLAFIMWNSCRRSIVPIPVIIAPVLASNVRET